MTGPQQILDALLPAHGVVVDGGFLREPGVLAFFSGLKYQDYSAHKDTDAVLAAMQNCTSYVIWCTIADDQHSYGPTLTVQGEGKPGKITIPWNRIITIVQLHERFKLSSVGFRVQPEIK